MREVYLEDAHWTVKSAEVPWRLKSRECSWEVVLKPNSREPLHLIDQEQ